MISDELRQSLPYIILGDDYFYPWSAAIVISTIQSLDDDTAHATLLMAAAGAEWELITSQN